MRILIAQNNLLVKKNNINLTAKGLVLSFTGSLEQGQDSFQKKKLTNEEYNNAIEYLNEEKKTLQNIKLRQLNFGDFDLKKLDGIQKGIRVFEGLSMQEIAFVCENLQDVLVNRGCSNRCDHCYINALPQHHKEGSNIISKMSKEDFDLLTKGLKTLNKRLGFNSIYKIKEGYFALFDDSDCIEIELKDKNGKIYDFADINDSAYEAFGRRGLFDTSGWSPNHKKHQERAEKIVKYFTNPENKKKMGQINVSINPFHGINKRAIELEKAGDIKKAMKFRKIYVERMANVLLTFTPIIEKMSIISRSFADYDAKAPDGYKKRDLEELYSEIICKLRTMYRKDYLSGEQKYIKTPSEAVNFLQTNKDKMFISTNIKLMGRAQKIIPETEGINQKIINEQQILYRLKNNTLYKLIDANGHLYVKDLVENFATSISLNFTNKNKSTPRIEGFSPDLKITKNIIINVAKRI